MTDKGYPIKGEPTSFKQIYDRFLGKITDDMYMTDDNDLLSGWTKEDTRKDLKNILIDSIPGFEFPRFPLYDYDLDSEEFNVHLSEEEINIFALLMYNTWLQRQVASVENIRMKYTGSDFKSTSQANHLSKLIELKKEAERQCFHMQRLYNRRKYKNSKGSIQSNWSTLAEISTFNNG